MVHGAGINPALWPTLAASPRDPGIEARISDLLSRMSLAEKVGQVIQADLGSVTPREARDYHLGSILNGGNSAPDGNNRATPRAYLDTVDAFFMASVDREGGRAGVPILWGTDAVHGHNNIVGATIFPHNIGLGAARDPDLIRRIGAATAMEVRATGMDWTFAPTLAVVRDDRWGRTYESYSEDPSIVAAYAAPMIEGLQGAAGSDDFLSPAHTIATAKHWVGDGGTVDGADQGDCPCSEEEMRDIHAAGYPPAIAAGVQVVMASFNTWNGRKMHGHEGMLRDVLFDRLGFDGFVVGDWNGHGQVEGCTNSSAAAAFNAGLDMFMAPDSWKGLYETTLRDVEEGRISHERLDEAVSRILRVKLRAGLFEAPRPKERRLAGEFSLLGGSDHRAIAREAVRKSAVLLKNDGVLPIRPSSRILLCGDGADDIGKQCGGWTISWQGTGNRNADFPNGQSIAGALRDAAGNISVSEDGHYEDRPDVAIVVFGEDPYAEFQGDRETVDFTSEKALDLMRRLRADGIPVVALFLSGRPLWVNPELNAANAFVAAFLPGTEAGGLADLLIGDEMGNPRHDFTGRLSFSWPRHPRQTPLNVDDADYDPLFAVGYGLRLADDWQPVTYDESVALPERGSVSRADLMSAGSARGDWELAMLDGLGRKMPIAEARAQTPDAALRIEAADWQAQEDTRLATWQGGGASAALVIGGPPSDFAREVNAQMSIIVQMRVAQPPQGRVVLSIRDAEGGETGADITDRLLSHGDRWGRCAIPLAMFDWEAVTASRLVEPFRIQTDDVLSLQIASISIAAWEEQASERASQ